VKGYSLSARTGTKAWAEGIVAEHPAGSQCTVHYDPDRPDRSVLNVEPESTPTVCLGTFDVLGFVVAGIGVLLLLVALALYLTSGAK
jgi:hypothetical protein